MNKDIKLFFVLLCILFLQSHYCIVSAWGEGYEQIPSIYSQNYSFSFKTAFSPYYQEEASAPLTVSNSTYVISDPLSPFVLAQNPDVFRTFKFLIPPGVESIIFTIDNNVYDTEQSDQCNMVLFEINQTNIEDNSFDTSTSANGILMPEDKADFWAGNKGLRMGWNSDKKTFALYCPETGSDNYALIEKSGVWCYMTTTSCVQQQFRINIQMNFPDKDKEEYIIWYNLMTEKGAWDDDGNPVSDLSILDDGDTISNLEITNVNIPTTAVVNKTVSCNIQISGGVAPYTYQVDFGDNVDDSNESKESNDLLASFDYVYTTAGSYTIKVKVTDDKENEVSGSYEITIQDDSDVYSVDFNYDSDSSDPYLYKFTPLDSNELPETYTYQWDFGIEGAESVSPDNPDTGEISYSFPAEGLYTVTLKLLSSDGVMLAEESNFVYVKGSELGITIVDDSNEDPSGKIYSLDHELTLKVSLEDPTSYSYSWAEYPNGTELVGSDQRYTYQCDTPGRHIIRLIVTEAATKRKGIDYAVIYVGEFDDKFAQGFESGIEYCKDYPLACGLAPIGSYKSGYDDGYQDALAYKEAQVFFADNSLSSFDLKINNMRFPLNGIEYELSCILEYMPYDGDEIFWRLLIDDSFNLDLVE